VTFVTRERKGLDEAAVETLGDPSSLPALDFRFSLLTDWAK
jgi:hypothetical protein